jgi:hypothetical protein
MDTINDSDNKPINHLPNFDSLVTNELKSTLSSFFNEIDIVFDNIDKSVVNSLNKFLEDLNEPEKMKHFITNTLATLKNYESEISHIVTSKQKIRTTELSFLNNIKLFDNILDFKCFESENKNTKQTIIKYLYNIYMSVYILNFGFVNDTQELNQFTQQLSTFISNIQKRSENTNTNTNTKHKNTTRKSHHTVSQRTTQNDIGGLLESLIQNNDIMSLATDLSKDIQSENIDPMMLLNSMLSGKPNNKVQQLVANISNKIETKIKTGEIDKNMLEQQANNIINTVKTTGGDFQKIFESIKK